MIVLVILGVFGTWKRLSGSGCQTAQVSFGEKEKVGNQLKRLISSKLKLI